MRLCIEPSSLPWVPNLCHPFWDDLRFNFAKFCFGQITMQLFIRPLHYLKVNLFVNFSSGEIFEQSILTGFFWPFLIMTFCLEPKRADNLVPKLVPVFLYCQAEINPVKTVRTPRIINMVIFSRGDRIFRQRTQIFILGPFFMLDGLDSSNLAGSGLVQSGGCHWAHQISGICWFYLIFANLGSSGPKNW